MWPTHFYSRKIAIVREQHVGGTQVAMSNLRRAVVTVLDGRNHLDEEIFGRLLAEVANGEQFILQVAAAGQLHHQIRGIGRPVHRRVQHLPHRRNSVEVSNHTYKRVLDANSRINAAVLMQRFRVCYLSRLNSKPKKTNLTTTVASKI